MQKVNFDFEVNLMKKCWLCLKDCHEEELTEEHIFPAACGGTLKVKCLCKECNDKLGARVDVGYANSFMNKLDQAFRDPSVNPFDKMPFGNGGFEYCIERNDQGEFSPRQNPKVEEENLQNGELRIQVAIDSQDQKIMESIISKKINRLTGKTLSQLELEELIGKNSKTVEVSPNEFQASFSIDINAQKLSLIKIIYEMTCYWLGEAYLSDPIGGRIRELLYETSRGQNPDPQSFQLRGSLFAVPDFFKLLFPNNKHIACLLPIGKKICCWVSIRGLLDCALLVTSEKKRYGNMLNCQDGCLLLMEPYQKYEEMSLGKWLTQLCQEGVTLNEN